MFTESVAVKYIWPAERIYKSLLLSAYIRWRPPLPNLIPLSVGILTSKLGPGVNIILLPATNVKSLFKFAEICWLLLEKAKPAAEREFSELTDFAKELDGIEVLEKWDGAYYSEKLKQKLFSLDDEILKPYFKLENVLNGSFAIAEKLFGITFKEVFDIDKYHENVQTFEVLDFEGKLVAVFYTDFFPRKGKRNGAWMTSFKPQYIKDGINERPHVSIVCNFTPPIDSSDSEQAKQNGKIVSDTENDILKMAVVNRYENAPPAIAFIKNFGLKKGAIASSVAHDCHNIVVVGTSDEEILSAVNLIIGNTGGICAVNGNDKKSLALPVAGIMSDQNGWEAGRLYQEIDAMAKELGSGLKAPFMTLSFMALLVIPDLKLSDKGLFSGNSFSFVDLEV